jgi:hypothetical protein
LEFNCIVLWRCAIIAANIAVAIFRFDILKGKVVGHRSDSRRRATWLGTQRNEVLFRGEGSVVKKKVGEKEPLPD